MPTVLGRIDTNSNDTRFTNTQGLYLLNTNGLPQGGFLHLLNSETNNNKPTSFLGRFDDDPSNSAYKSNYNVRFGNFIWRYSDLQKGVPGDLYHYDEVANRLENIAKKTRFGFKPNEIYRGNKGSVQGYAGCSRIDFTGTTYTTTYDLDYSNSYQKEGSPETRGILPAMGSNFDDVTIMSSNYYSSVHNTGKRRIPGFDADGFDKFETTKMAFEAFDPKALNWFIFSTGDIRPDSMSRGNHIGYGSKDFTNYSVTLKSNGNKVGSNKHSKYKGSVSKIIKDDNDYENHNIIAASITPNNMKRFGLIRLTELTLDWHFNNVDVENLVSGPNPSDNNTVHLYNHGRLYAASEFGSYTDITSTNVRGGNSTITVNNINLLTPERTGTADSGSSTSLVDAAVNFTTWAVTAGMIIENTTTKLVGLITAKTNDTTLATAIPFDTDDTYKIYASRLFTDPYAENPRYIGKVSSINSGTKVVTLASAIHTSTSTSRGDVFSSSSDYSGGIYISYNGETGGPTKESGENSSSDKYDIRCPVFNKHLITGPRLRNWNMIKSHSSLGSESQCVISENKLVLPVAFGPSTAFDYDLTDYRNQQNAFQSLVTNGRQYVTSHSRIIQEMTPNTANYNKLYNNTIGLITKNYKPWTFKSVANKNTHALKAQEVLGDAAGNRYVTGSYGLKYLSASEEIMIDLNSNDREETIASFRGGIFTNPGDDANSGNPGIRLISYNIKAYHDWRVAHPGLSQRTVPVGEHANAGFTDGSDDYISKLILAGKEVANSPAESGMTFPVKYQMSIKGDNQYVFPMVRYAWGDNVDSIIGNFKHEKIASGELIGGEVNSFMGHDSGNYLFKHNQAQDYAGITNAIWKSDQTGAEVFYKPQLDLVSDDAAENNFIVTSIDGKTRALITITMENKDFSDYIARVENDAATGSTDMHYNRWLHYAPNLTGYYLVSETGVYFESVGTAVSNRKLEGSIPGKIHYIVSHIIEKTGDASNPHEVKHYLEIDNVSYSGSNPTLDDKYRVMKIADNCFYDFSPNEIDLFKLSKRYSKMPYEERCYANVSKFNEFSYPNTTFTTDSVYNEGILSMYLPVEVDGRTSDYIVNRTTSTLFTSDGAGNTFANDTIYDMFITDGNNSNNTKMTVERGISGSNPVSLIISNQKQINGLASLGEIFTVDIFNKPSFDPVRANIGTAFHVVNEVEDIVNEVLESNDIVYTKTTDTNRYYQGFDIQGMDLYSACNFVSSFKDRKLLIEGSNIQLKKDIEDIDYTDIEVSDKDINTDVGQIERNKSLFDYYNEVIVYGNGVKSIMRDNANIRKTGKTSSLEVVDLTIITEFAAQERAKKLLKLHTDNAHSIKFTNTFKNTEYLKPGQLIKMDYTTEHIPRDTYQVLGIDYHLAGMNEITVGKYNSNLTQRLSELSKKNDNTDARLRNNRFQTNIYPTIHFENISIKNTKLVIRRTGTGSATTIGFGNTIGFNSTIGLVGSGGSTTTTTLVDEDLA